MSRHILTSAIVVAAVFAIVLVLPESPFARCAGPVMLSQDECALLIGGQNGCPEQNCSCASQGCQTSGCPTTSTTCQDDGNGGCVLVQQTSGSYCGQPNTQSPNGCVDWVVSGTCGVIYTGTPIFYYGNKTCTYPTIPPICRNQGANCGQAVYGCENGPT